MEEKDTMYSQLMSSTRTEAESIESAKTVQRELDNLRRAEVSWAGKEQQLAEHQRRLDFSERLFATRLSFRFPISTGSVKCGLGPRWAEQTEGAAGGAAAAVGRREDDAVRRAACAEGGAACSEGQRQHIKQQRWPASSSQLLFAEWLRLFLLQDDQPFCCCKMISVLGVAEWFPRF